MSEVHANNKIVVACKTHAYVHALSLRSRLKRKRLPLSALLVRCIELCSNFILLVLKSSLLWNALVTWPSKNGHRAKKSWPGGQMPALGKFPLSRPLKPEDV
jgi:hypothetical protein